MLDKTYSTAEIELKHDRAWQEGGHFEPSADPAALPFCIMIPPPNVTGSLHIGHALNNTIQDTLVRFERMRGRAVLWQPGSDHAGIATQMVVERELAKEGRSRHDLGREGFIAKVWEWREQSGGLINKQLRRLGASLAWSRERFTMDEGLSAAVRKVFVDLYRDGLIYKDKRLVNWDCRLQTAVSDLEVDPREVDGHLWYVRYPIEGLEGRFIAVATTRPETMLGDTGIAVHPEDERWRDLIGRHAILPLVGRRLPIVGDGYSDPEKGSGAVKITPGHDFNDFEVGRRHGFAMINIMDAGGRLNDEVPQPYRGLDRFVARERVVADLEALGLIEKTEPIRHTVPYSQRSETPLEPILSDQWYADARRLAQPAIKAVEEGRTRFVPKQWENVYFEWMRNIQPWCISRQLWWGHQIPAWYGPDGEIFVATDEDEAHALALRHYGRKAELVRDPDVLDTWFSSALWPFSTLGWPEQTPELERYYPTSVLVTAYDIIFFWVARMMMTGVRFMGEVPFGEVLIHGLVRDERGQKMSKSKGNVIDPLALIDRYGADALRFAVLASTVQGRDIKLGEARVQGYRNFTTKLWNAARFCELNGCEPDPAFRPEAVRETVNRWVASKLTRAITEVTAGLQGYRFNEAAGALYRFTWDEFCDWYLELAKPLLTGEDAAARAETRATAAWALGQLLHLLHPMTPFVTEELWGRRYAGAERPLIVSRWPEADERLLDAEAEAELDWLVRAITAIRAARSEVNVPAAARLEAEVKGASAETRSRLERHREAIFQLARLKDIQMEEQIHGDAAVSGPNHRGVSVAGTTISTGGAGATSARKSSVAGATSLSGSIQVVVDEATFALPVADIVDLEQERARLDKEIAKVLQEVRRVDAKLSNPQFLQRAPEEVIEEQRERRAEAEAVRQRLEAALARMAS